MPHPTPHHDRTPPAGSRPALLARVLEGGEPPSEWRLFRAGANDTEYGTFHFTPESARVVMEEARRWGNEHSADYEHAAAVAPEAPAAAWYELEVRDSEDGPELWAVNIRWTTRAAEYIRAREYRYISPWFWTDWDGQITGYVNFALTNIPATRHMDALIAASRSRLDPPEADSKEEPMTTNPNARIMQQLGLRPDASEDAALEALAPLVEARETMRALSGLVPEGADVVGTITAWRDGAKQAEQLQAQIDEQTASAAKARVDQLVATGLRDGKLTPGSKDALLSGFADADGNVDPARLEAYLKVAPRAVTTSRHQEPAGNADTPATPAPASANAEGQTEYEQYLAAHGNVGIARLRADDPDEFTRLLTAHRAARYGRN